MPSADTPIGARSAGSVPAALQRATMSSASEQFATAARAVRVSSSGILASERSPSSGSISGANARAARHATASSSPATTHSVELVPFRDRSPTHAPPPLGDTRRVRRHTFGTVAAGSTATIVAAPDDAMKRRSGPVRTASSVGSSMSRTVATAPCDAEAGAVLQRRRRVDRARPARTPTRSLDASWHAAATAPSPSRRDRRRRRRGRRPDRTRWRSVRRSIASTTGRVRPHPESQRRRRARSRIGTATSRRTDAASITAITSVGTAPSPPRRRPVARHGQSPWPMTTSMAPPRTPA